MRLLLVVLVVLVAGCTSGGIPALDGDTPTPEPAAGDGGSSDGTDCQAGESYTWADPQSGEQVSLEIQGIVEHEGRQVCKAVWETNDADGEYSRVVMYYSEDDSYQKIIYYDDQGNVVQEFEASDPGQAGTPGGDGDGTAAGGDDWCVEGQSMSYADPQTGESTSMEVQGVVQHEGHEVCKYVYETNDTDTEYSRMVMFLSEDDSYQKIVYYDADGNVVDEFVMSQGVTTTEG